MYENSKRIDRPALADFARTGPVEHEQVCIVPSEQPGQDQAEFFSQAQL
jgi:hypothetical protein